MSALAVLGGGHCSAVEFDGVLECGDGVLADASLSVVAAHRQQGRGSSYRRFHDGAIDGEGLVASSSSGDGGMDDGFVSPTLGAWLARIYVVDPRQSEALDRLMLS
jgi:hypothetical protein